MFSDSLSSTNMCLADHLNSVSVSENYFQVL